MALRQALMTLAILLMQSQSFVAQTPVPPALLEIHVDTPRWLNGCLDLTIERANVSSQTIYLPKWEPLLFELSTRPIHGVRKKRGGGGWLLFYGLSDIVDYDANEFPSGSKTTDHFCLPETFAVVNQQQKTRRQVGLRGHLRIVASYFPTQDDWKTSKAEEEKRMPAPWHSPSSSLEISVPCLPDCAASCETLPLIAEGERVVVPDVFQFHKDWNERGAALSITLNPQDVACGK